MRMHLISLFNSCMIRKRVMEIVFFRKSMGFLLICIVLLMAVPVRAFTEESEFRAISDEELQELVESYLTENGINSELVSVGYIYTETDESWYFNGDKNYYSASLYKVPLMMLFAEQESAGELTQESEIYGMTLSYIEEEVLVSSNNPIAYSMMCYLGEPATVRAMFQRYSELPEEYYSWDFCSYSYFTAHFMTDVMRTLYTGEERFPHIMERLKRAQPGHFFRLRLGDEEYEIAQKYGSYHDDAENDWNHAAGIIFTEHPFVLVVMTRYGGMSENIISDLAVLLKDYTLKADERLALHRAEETAERERQQEEEEKTIVKEETPKPTASPISSETSSSDEDQAGSQVSVQISDAVRLAAIAVAAVLILLLCLIKRKR